MGRGKPFSQSLNSLVSAGVVQRPVWMNSVESTRPPFEPIVSTKPGRIEYPEDRLRNIFLQRNPNARRIPVNLRATSVPERHIADKFVSIQMQIMDEDKLSEEEAYNAANRILNHPNSEADHAEDDLYGPLSNPAITNESARLYLASVKDSQRDKALHRALVKQAMETS